MRKNLVSNNIKYQFAQIANRLSHLFIFVAIASTIVSCSSDDNHTGNFLISWVTVQEEGASFLLDNGSSLWVKSSNSGYVPDNERVLINYTLLEETHMGYDSVIHLNSYVADILTKDIIYIDSLDTVKQDSIGNNPMKIISLWEGGGYLNAKFELMVGNKSNHFINLVSCEPDLGVNKDTVHLELRHNANNDPANYKKINRVSFRLNTLNTASRDELVLSINVEIEEDKKQTYIINYKVRQK